MIRKRAERLANVALSFEALEPRKMLDAGNLDFTFDVDGFNLGDTESSFGHRAGSAIAVQPDGKIVAVGFTGTPEGLPYQGVVARFNSDGSIDSSFANNGIFVETALGGDVSRGNRLRDVEIDSAGRIVYAGDYGLVGRLNPDGTPDASFGNLGPTNPGRFFGGERASRQFKIIINPDDSIFVAGAGFNIVNVSQGGPNSLNDPFVYKLSSHGLPITGFGASMPSHGTSSAAFVNGGIAYADFDFADEYVDGATIDPNGNLVLVGDATLADSTTAVAYRFLPNGQIDTSFGEGGQMTLFGRRGMDVLFDSSGRMLVSGLSWIPLENGNTAYVSRLDTNLNYDPTFSGDGILGIPTGGDRQAGNMVLQSDGKIIVGGGPDPSLGAIARVDINGDQDSSFGTNGISWINYPPRGGVNDVALQPDGKIVFVGGHFNVDGDSFSDYVLFVGRLEGDIQPVVVSGRVFDDANNDGSFQSGLGETGIADITVTLTGTDIYNHAVNRTTQTLADGTFSFDEVLPGTYSLTNDQPVGFLDGKETSGNFGGTVDNASDNNSIVDFVIGTDGTPATDYLFAEIRPAELSGLVWEDFNDDGQVNFGETAIENVLVALTGTDDRGNVVNLDSYTDNDGVFMFSELRPGEYSLAETQSAGFVDAAEVLGIIDGLMAGTVSGNDQFSNLVLKPGSVGINYNFAERPLNGGQVSSGQTATIGFWQNNNGRALILAMNGGANSTQLSSWLAATLPNMYGADAGGNDLTGMTNLQVWEFYNALFRRKQKEAQAMGLGGPVKTDAQVFATTLAVYVTNENLAGTTGTSYGFAVSPNGVGTSTFNVGSSGQAFGVANGTVVSVMDLLLAVNERSRNGVLYDMDADGDANDSLEISLRTMLNNVFSAINEAGGS